MMHIGLLLFPRLTLLDLTGPLEVFGRIHGCQVSLVWKTREPVASDRGVALLPTHTFADAPQPDLICVPGGPGQVDLMADAETLGYLRTIAPGCAWVTSVCTGSLVLAAAGLLSGYRATCHWSSLDQLEMFGAIPTVGRVVRDRNRVTGAGVSAGIDFALNLAGTLAGEDVAREIQLQIEYDPAPPYASGSPSSADPAMLERLTQRMAPFIEKRRRASQEAARRLGR